MDCCGMPLAVRAGGGFVCRRCQAEYDVPVGTSLNRAAWAVDVGGAVLNPLPAGAVMPAAVDWSVPSEMRVDELARKAAAFPVEQPKVSGFGRGGGRKGGPK